MGGTGSGRPGKPTVVLKRQGTFRDDRHAKRVDDAMYDGVPKKPTNLKGDALKLWKLLEPQLVGSGVATEVDAPAMESMCRWWGLWREQMSKLESGYYDDDDLSTASVIAARYHREWRMMASRFGLSPADRLRFERKADDTEEDSASARFGIIG